MSSLIMRALAAIGPATPLPVHHHHDRQPRLLFILKKRSGYWGAYGDDVYSSGPGSTGTGLFNSVRFLRGMLEEIGIDARMVEVTDNNDIDREVTKHRPTHVIIEAFWVVPEKFDVLQALHPNVHWIVRDHSETPFLANEGSAFGWAREYLQRGVEVMCNSRRAAHDMGVIAADLELSCFGPNFSIPVPPELVTYGPNYYPIIPMFPERARKDPNYLHVGCFGAIRPLKNHMTQAIAALEFARVTGMGLRFHINGGRCEGGGEPILKSMRAVLGPRLVEHEWLAHHDFLELMRTMDISLQVSFTETFNIVTADAVATGVPVVVSPEIGWLDAYAHADPTSAASIVATMERIWCTPRWSRIERQRKDLEHWNRHSERVWGERFMVG